MALLLTERAAKEVKRIMVDQKLDDGTVLRVGVRGGGCSGFSYKFGFDDAAKADDLVLERDGARVLIDEMSLEFLVGSEIDYARELIGAAFKITNPNAVANCGCRCWRCTARAMVLLAPVLPAARVTHAT